MKVALMLKSIVRARPLKVFGSDGQQIFKAGLPVLIQQKPDLPGIFCLSFHMKHSNIAGILCPSGHEMNSDQPAATRAMKYRDQLAEPHISRLALSSFHHKACMFR
jgi:hypothetical protein